MTAGTVQRPERTKYREFPYNLSFLPLCLASTGSDNEREKIVATHHTKITSFKVITRLRTVFFYDTFVDRVAWWKLYILVELTTMTASFDYTNVRTRSMTRPTVYS